MSSAPHTQANDLGRLGPLNDTRLLPLPPSSWNLGHGPDDLVASATGEGSCVRLRVERGAGDGRGDNRLWSWGAMASLR